MENAVVYARYSSHNQSELSIEGQLDAAYKYAEQHGLNIIRTYEDRAKTGTNDKRPGFQQMLSDCKKHDFTVIIVWKVDRFGRNKEEITFNKYKCKKEGVRVEYVAESIGEGNEAVILESVLEGMAEYYSKQLSTNVKRGREVAKAKGNWGGGWILYGYKAENKRAVINPEEAAVVQNIFQSYADGKTMAEIASMTGLIQQRVSRILHNRGYIGEDNYPALIDRELFDRVQARIKSKVHRRATIDLRQNYALTSKLYCSCGRHMFGTMSRARGKEYNYYVCSGRQTGECHRPSFRQDENEDLVFEAIKEALSDSEKVVDTLWERYEERTKAVKPPRMALERVRKAEKGIENIMKAIEQGMNFELVRERLSALQSEKEEAMYELEKYNTQKQRKLTKEEIRNGLKHALEATDKRVIMDRYVEKLVFDGEKINVMLNLGFGVDAHLPWRVNVYTKFSLPARKEV